MAYTPTQEALLQQCRELAEQAGGQSAAAKLMGISPVTFSQLLSGTYGANPQRQFDKIAAYFAIKEAAITTYAELPYAETYVSESACDIMALCHAKGGFAIICGDAGVGKTKAIERYASQHPTNTVVVTVNECFARSKALLGLIADAIGASREKQMDAMWQAVAAKLSDGTMIIIDESQHLSLRTVDMLRSLPDHFRSRGQTVGICLVGNLETGHKFGTRSSALAQVKNRTRYTATYTTQRIQRNDIVKLFPLLADGINDLEIDFLLRIAQSEQGVRGTVNLFSNAYDNDNITYEGLVAMAKQMEVAP